MSAIAGVRDVVVARDAVWRVLAVDEGEACRALLLERLAPPPRGVTKALIEPFDAIRPVPPAATSMVVSRRAVGALAGELCLRDRTWIAPASLAELALTVPSWQLVPAVVILSGHARRLLVADAVGLGKTIQAGILIRELLMRGVKRRVLVLVPAGLRTQWRAELSRHFAVTATIADLAWLERQGRALPKDVNPWTRERLVLVSTDFAKRDEIQPGPQDTVWDLVVVDEAHAVGVQTARASLVESVCRTAGAVLLLTATPHGGQPTAFDALCRIGAREGEPPLAIVRRTSRDVASRRPPARRRTWLVDPTPDERALASLLERYLTALDGASRHASIDTGALSLLTQVLRKRAASSAASLARTLRRRLELLAVVSAPVQAGLPFAPDTAGDDDLPDTVLAVPGFDRPGIERAWLGALIHAADRAARADSRLTTLRRFLRRTREPVIVFTEYRDTLAYLVRHLRDAGSHALLHGGQSSRDREVAVSDFSQGASRLLLATDAASEGLNLQARCRCVLLWELPWTPARLDQRIGRVDRLGQQRRVHVVSLMRRDADFDAWLRDRHDLRRRTADAALVRGARAERASTVDATAESLGRYLALRRRLVTAARRGTRGAVANLAGSWNAAFAGAPVSCLPADRSRDWSGLLAIVDGVLERGGEIVDEAVIGVHLPLAVPRLAARGDVRRFMIRHAHLAGPVLGRAREAIRPRWHASQSAWHACGVGARVFAAPRPGQGRTRGPRQPSLFGRYSPGPASNQPGADTASAPRPPEVGLHERVTIALILLGPGEGHLRQHPPDDSHGW